MLKNHKDPKELDLAWSKQKVEKTSTYGALGRHQPGSKERIEFLSDKIERHHSLRYTPSLLCPESCSDGKWRNYTRESIYVVSAK